MFFTLTLDVALNNVHNKFEQVKEHNNNFSFPYGMKKNEKM
jgi:hypothetical protein